MTRGPQRTGIERRCAGRVGQTTRFTALLVAGMVGVMAKGGATLGTTRAVPWRGVLTKTTTSRRPWIVALVVATRSPPCPVRCTRVTR